MTDDRRAAHRIRRWGSGVILAAGTTIVGVVGAAAAHADDLPTLPLPPFNPPPGYFTLPGTPGVPTHVESFSIPGLYSTVAQDNSYSVPDGSYQTHFVEQTFGGAPPLPSVGGGGSAGGNGFPAIGFGTEQVTASDGAAPAVGTEWDLTGLQAPLILGVPGAMSQLMLDSRLTTPEGTADLFWILGLENDFYYGPAGIFDYVGFLGNEASFVPIIDIPAAGAPAADFAMSWPELLGTL